MDKARSHHTKQDFDYHRASYREPRWERATKVYTINQESRYLLVQGVPCVGASEELIKRFALYGDVEEYRLLDEYPAEEFTEVYWIKFVKIQAARFAKKKLDNRSFFGGLLHVCYAPEYESVEDTRQKLQDRRIHVARRCRQLGYREKDGSKTSTSDVSNANSNQVEGMQKSVDFVSPISNNSSVRLSRANETSTGIGEQSKQKHLPLPPSDKGHQAPTAPDPMLPRIASKQASLPADVQQISVNEAYNINQGHPSYRNNSIDNIIKSTVEQKDKVDQDQSKVGSKSSSSAFILQHTNKRINWFNDKHQPTTSQVTLASSCTPTNSLVQISIQPHIQHHFYGVEPGAWDPHRLKRKAERSMTGDDHLDATLHTIRQKLSKSSQHDSPAAFHQKSIAQVSKTTYIQGSALSSKVKNQIKTGSSTLQSSSEYQKVQGSFSLQTAFTPKRRKDDGRKRI